MASETVHGRRSLLSLLFHFLKRLDKMMWINIVTLVHNLAEKRNILYLLTTTTRRRNRKIVGNCFGFFRCFALLI